MHIALFTLFVIYAFSSVNAEVHFIEEKSSLPDDPILLYLDLAKKCIANTIYEDPAVKEDFFHPRKYNKFSRQNGRDWPSVAHTMIGMKRLDNIQYCMEEVLKNQVPGDFIKTGVWRGGSTIFMKAVLQAYRCKDRRVWVADSFEGLPPPNADKYPDDQGLYLNRYSYLAVSLEDVQENFRRYGLLDDQVVFLKGLFSRTLPTAPIKEIAVLRLDGDLYESTMDALTSLYPKLSVGGYIIVDDYGAIAACAKAVTDYRLRHHITDPIISIDGLGVFWQKYSESLQERN